MSFLGGAECSTGANPLAQFSKHTQDDHSLQRDRLVGRGPGGMQESMRTQQMGPGQEGVSVTAQPAVLEAHDRGDEFEYQADESRNGQTDDGRVYATEFTATRHACSFGSGVEDGQPSPKPPPTSC